MGFPSYVAISSKVAGGVRANFSDELNIVLRQCSLAAFENFAIRPRQEIDLHQDGYLFVLTTPEDVQLFEKSVTPQNAMGVNSRILTAEQAQEISPLLSTEDVLAAASSSPSWPGINAEKSYEATVRFRTRAPQGWPSTRIPLGRSSRRAPFRLQRACRIAAQTR